jgi:hypothetical protein
MEGSRGGGGNCWPVKPVCYLPQASTDRPASNYPGLTLAHPGLKLFTGLPAVTIAAQLAPHHRGGRHGHEFADPLIETAIANHINHTSPAIRPHAALKAVLSQVEPIVDVVQVAEPSAVACGRADCVTHRLAPRTDEGNRRVHCHPGILFMKAPDFDFVCGSADCACIPGPDFRHVLGPER